MHDYMNKLRCSCRYSKHTLQGAFLDHYSVDNYLMKLLLPLASSDPEAIRSGSTVLKSTLQQRFSCSFAIKVILLLLSHYNSLCSIPSLLNCRLSLNFLSYLKSPVSKCSIHRKSVLKQNISPVNPKSLIYKSLKRK